MAFERIVEEKIRAAMEEGKFDNLEGRGRPVDLDGYFATPADLRLGYSILKSAGCLPPEVELMREIEALQTRLAACRDEAECRALAREIESRQLRLALRNDSRRSRRGAR